MSVKQKKEERRDKKKACKRYDVRQRKNGIAHFTHVGRNGFFFCSVQLGIRSESLFLK